MTHLELAELLDAKAMKTLKEVVGSVLGATTYGSHLDYAERALRIADMLRARASVQTEMGEVSVRCTPQEVK